MRYSVVRCRLGSSTIDQKSEGGLEAWAAYYGAFPHGYAVSETGDDSSRLRERPCFN
jgi:hypothetical protein